MTREKTDWVEKWLSCIGGEFVGEVFVFCQWGLTAWIARSTGDWALIADQIIFIGDSRNNVVHGYSQIVGLWILRYNVHHILENRLEKLLFSKVIGNNQFVLSLLSISLFYSFFWSAFCRWLKRHSESQYFLKYLNGNCFLTPGIHTLWRGSRESHTLRIYTLHLDKCPMLWNVAPSVLGSILVHHGTMFSSKT